MNGELNGKKRVASVWFIETKRFTEAWRDLQLDAEDLIDLQNMIMADPFRNPVVSGTGGLRKVRFAAPSMGKGKGGVASMLRVLRTALRNRTCFAVPEKRKG